MSLRGRLLLLLGLSWLLLGGGMTLWLYERASSQMDSALDSRLAASAGMVGRLLSQLPLAEASPAQGEAAPLDVLARDGVACEVSEWRAEVLARTVARTPGSPRLRAAGNGFGYLEQKGVRWRTYVLEQGELRIATADRMDLRDGLRREVALAAILPFGVCLLAGSLLLWLGIGRGLAPLERLRRALTADVPLERIDLPRTPVPRELRPFTQTISGLLRRMREALLRERRFADNAAHEMRTPLTVVTTHLQVLDRLTPPEDPRRASLGSALQGANRLRRLIDQLLSLARVENAAAPAERAELAAAARQALEGLAPQRLELDLPRAPVHVGMPAPLLASALRNLVDNALKYSPADRPVRIAAAVSGATVDVRVRDHGPGLPAEALEMAQEPFWRGGRQVEGSGLGLAIVAAIARRFDGRLELVNAAGGGLECRLALPRAG
ncbi:sensor histidine kinase [Bordetella hinzii]|uniref:sensor histidine kinase n=1 Tax=Bordetella hinzii TaxID=103855 RepID=UPI0039FCDD90